MPSHEKRDLPATQDFTPSETSHFEGTVPFLDDEGLADAIAALERRAAKWERPATSPLVLARYSLRRRMRCITACVRAHSGWIAAGSFVTVAALGSLFAQREFGRSSALQESFAEALKDAGRDPAELLSGSVSFEDEKLGALFLQGAQGNCAIKGDECIAMAGSDGKDYCFVMRLMNEEAAALCLPPEPTVLYLLSRRIQEERHSAIILPFGKESYCVLRGDEAGFHPCMREEDLAFLQPLLTDFPMLTRGSPTPKYPRWQDADSDGKLDRFYAWGGDRGIRRMNEVVLPQVRKLAGLE